jgi:acyl carrier protein
VTSPDVTGQVRQILAELTSDSWPLRASLDTPLLRDGVGLDSLRGALLLTRVRDQFGVDVASEDLNLDAMATIGTLAAFISRRVGAGG